MDCRGFEPGADVGGGCGARRAGPARDMRSVEFCFLTDAGTGIPDRILPCKSGAGWAVERRRLSIIVGQCTLECRRGWKEA
jgi:hypothetical protein